MATSQAGPDARAEGTGRPTRWRSIRKGVVVLAAASGVAASWWLAPGMGGFMGALLAVLMTAVAYVDSCSYTIPDELTATGVALGLIQAALQGGDTLAGSVLFAVARGLVVATLFWLLRAGYRWLRGRDGLGLGDVKLAAVAGAWLGWTAVPIAVEVAALSGIAFYAVRQVALGRPVRAAGRLPFGAVFAPAIWLAWALQVAMLGNFG